jgi:hypothetical protein
MPKPNFNFLLTVFCICFWTVGFSQRKTIHSDQQWIQYYSQFELSKKWIGGFDAGYRWKDGERFQYIARVGIGYQLNQRFRISSGFATTGNYTNSDLTRIEFRPYEEILHSGGGKRILFLQRFRVEERFFKILAQDAIPASHDFNFRFRYQISLSIPIVTLSQSRPDKRISLGISDEVFINAGKEIVYNTFDRNRIVVGPIFHFSKSFSVALSYMMQYTKLNQPATYNWDDVVWLTARHTIHKKEVAEID